MKGQFFTSRVPAILFVLAAAAIGASGCVTEAHGEPHAEPVTLGSGAGQAAAPVLPVVQYTVSPSTSQPTVVATGTTALVHTADLAAEVTAMVSEVHVQAGDWVEAGTVLVELDQGDLRLRTAQAEAQKAQLEVQLRTTERDLERYEPLLAQGIVTDATLLQFEGQRDALTQSIAAAEHAVALTRSAQRDAVVRAPFAGRVIEVPAALGEMATSTPATTLVRLVAVDELDVLFDVPEADLVLLREGMAVQVSIPAAGHSVESTIRWMDPSVAAGSRMGRVVVRIPNPERRLFAGLFARMEVTAGEARTALRVPQEAVVQTGNAASVLVIEQGVAHERAVQIGHATDAWVEVLDGLAQGEVIVAARRPELVEGVAVTAASEVAP